MKNHSNNNIIYYIMNLEQLTNNELLDRFDKLDHTNYLFKDRSQKVLDAYLDLLLLPGVQDYANNSRQTIIDFIQEQEELQQPKGKRRIEGGRRRKSRRGKKSRRSKSRRNRK
jgi:hypothetical protein